MTADGIEVAKVENGFLVAVKTKNKQGGLSLKTFIAKENKEVLELMERLLDE